MKKHIILILIIAIALVAVPVLAEPASNHQSVDKGNNNYQSQSTDSQNIIGNGNTQNTQVYNSNGGDITSGATAVNNQQSVLVNLNPGVSHYTLGIPDITNQITSIYSGEVLAIDNDGGNNIMQRAGEEYTYTIQSSIPVLAYIVPSREDDRVKSKSGAPTYDEVNQKYDHKNIDISLDNHLRSTQQQFTFIIPEDGRYSLIIDSRVSNFKDGVQASITADSVDVAFSIQKLNVTAPVAKYVPQVIGTVNTFPTDSNGHIINT